MDNFIGEIISRYDHYYKVISVVEGSKPKQYIISCSVCSLDEELYPLGSIKSTKHKLIKRNTTPCGCGGRNTYTKQQIEILIKRRLANTGYEFLSFVDRYDGFKSKVRVRDTYTGYEACSFTVGRIFERGISSTTTRYENTKDRHVEDFFNSGSFHKDTEFYRNPVDAKQWWYICPVCSKDEYSVKGLCTGRFKSNITLLKRGCMACRCSKGFKFTQDQRELQVNNICKNNGWTFIGWAEEFRGSHTRIDWECKLGHENQSSIDNFTRGKGCRGCAWATGDGYFPSRKLEADYLYVCSVTECRGTSYPIGQNYFKVGRSFYPDRRMKELAKESEKKDNTIRKFSIQYLYTGSHIDVYSMEQTIHKEIFAEDKPTNGYGSSELISNTALDKVLSYLKGIHTVNQIFDISMVEGKVNSVQRLCKGILTETINYEKLSEIELIRLIEKVSYKLSTIISGLDNTKKMLRKGCNG